MIRILKKNWKTTISGILILMAVTLYLFNRISTEQFTTATAFIVSLGFFYSKDHNNNSYNGSDNTSQNTTGASNITN